MEHYRVLVTGSAGAIGYFLTKSLAERGYKVFAVDNFIRGKKDKLYEELLSKENVEHIEIDLTKPEEVKELPKNVDYVYHLAALNGTQNFYEVPFDVVVNSTLPTVHLLYHYKDSHLKRFVYAGSSEAYASTVSFFNWRIPTGENVPLCIEDVKNVRWSYAASKLLGEIATVSASKQFGIPYTIVRYHNVFGPRMGDKHVIPDFIQRIKEGRYELYGCDNTRSFIYVEDAVEITISLAESDRGANDIFNVGSEREIRIFELGNLILKLIGIENVKIKCYPAPEGSVKRRLPDINKLKKTLNFKPKYSLEEGLKRTIKYYLGGK